MLILAPNKISPWPSCKAYPINKFNTPTGLVSLLGIPTRIVIEHTRRNEDPSSSARQTPTKELNFTPSYRVFLTFDLNANAGAFARVIGPFGMNVDTRIWTLWGLVDAKKAWRGIPQRGDQTLHIVWIPRTYPLQYFGWVRSHQGSSLLTFAFRCGSSLRLFGLFSGFVLPLPSFIFGFAERFHPLPFSFSASLFLTSLLDHFPALVLHGNFDRPNEFLFFLISLVGQNQ